MTQPMQPKKAPSMWERYQSRAAIRPSHKHVSALGDMQRAANTHTEMFEHILDMLTDHASNIDALKLQLKETKEFMDWAISTHGGLLNEYNAVKDVMAATGSDEKLSKLIGEWGAE